MWHGFLIFIGLTNGSGHAYLFWSGIGSDISEVMIVGALITLLRKHNCEVHGCWRMGKHQTEAGHSVCRKHHPDDKLTASDVKKAHLLAKFSKMKEVK